MGKENCLDLMEDLLGVSLENKKTYAEQEWEGMPEYVSNNLESKHKLIVHFRTNEDKLDFAELVKQPITSKTKSLWLPRKDKDSYSNRRYVSDES